MPREWLIILQQENSDPVDTMLKLEQMTVKQVYRVLETLEMKKMYAIEKNRIQSQGSK